MARLVQAVQAVRLKAVKVAQAVREVREVREVRLRVAPAGPEAVCFRAVVVADRSLALPRTRAVQLHRHLHVKDLTCENERERSQNGCNRVVQVRFPQNAVQDGHDAGTVPKPS